MKNSNDMEGLAEITAFGQRVIEDLCDRPNPEIGKYECRVGVLTGKRTCNHFSCRPPEKGEP